MKDVGKLMVVAGCFLILAGFIAWFGGDKLKWIGKLPGDISVKKPGFSLFVPITSMILVSILLSLIIWVLRKFF